MPVEFVWIGIAFLIILLGVRVFVIERKLRVLFRGGDAKSLEGLVYEHSQQIRTLENESEFLRKMLMSLEERFLSSVQKVSMVRFNPFSESGGDQSFVIVLLNNHNNGFILSSLYFQGRQMLYAKPVEKGVSRYTLSDEERNALTNALEQA